MAKKEKKSKNTGEEVTLEMTPMIDVVFQLLIFFIVTLKQDDILSSLEALRPAPDKNATSDATEPVTILIGRHGFVFNGRPMSERQLTESFVRLAKGSKDTMIMIKCTDDSPHGYLVRALDILSSVGLYKVSVFSM